MLTESFERYMKVNFEFWSWSQSCLILIWWLYISGDRHVSSAAVKPMLVDTVVFAQEKGFAERGERHDWENRLRRARGESKIKMEAKEQKRCPYFTSNEKWPLGFWSANFHIPEQLKWSTDLYLTIQEFPGSSMRSDRSFSIVAKRCIKWGMVGKIFQTNI